MASRKKSLKTPAPATLREFTVVLEKIYTDYKVFGESLDGLRTQFGGLQTQFGGLQTQFEGLQTQFGGLQTQFGGLSARFDRLETRMEAGFAQVDARFERVENDVSALKRDTELIKVAVMTHSRELKELRSDVADLAAKKVDRDEVEGIVKRVVGSGAR